MSALLDAAYPLARGQPDVPQIDAMTTIRPLPLRRIPGSTSRITLKVPVTLTSMWDHHSAGDCSSSVTSFSTAA